MKSIDIYRFVENFNLICQGKKPQSSSSLYFKFARGSKVIRAKVVEIYNEINCAHYTFDDFKHYVFYYHLYEEKHFWFRMNKMNISGCKERLFSNNSLNKDKNLLIMINNDIKFTIDDYLKIQENGECYLYLLLKNKNITPALYLRLVNSIDETEKTSEQQRKANKIAKIIKEIKNGNA
jgi:hypothetical protein